MSRTMVEFFRFPHTPHLTWLGTESPRDDKVLDAAEASALLAGAVLVEEKLDDQLKEMDWRMQQQGLNMKRRLLGVGRLIDSVLAEQPQLF